MKMFEIHGKMELHFEEPFVHGPEMDEGAGRLVKGYILFRNDAMATVGPFEDIPNDAMLRWPVWVGETQAMQACFVAPDCTVSVQIQKKEAE